MKKYAYRLLTIFLIAAVFVVLSKYNSFNIANFSKSFTNETTHDFNECSLVDNNQTYYTTESTLNVYSTDDENSSVAYTIDECREITVYCISSDNEWALISDTEDEFVKLEELSSDPCINEPIPNPSELTFTLNNVLNIDNVLKGADNIITFDVIASNSDFDSTKLTAKITGIEFEDNIISTNIVDTTISYSYNTNELNTGNYTIEVLYDETVIDSFEFRIRNIITELSVHGDNLVANKNNAAIISMVIREDGEEKIYNKQSVTYEIQNSSSTNVTSQFYVGVINDNSSDVLKIVPKNEIQPGEYQVYIDVDNLTYTNHISITYGESEYSIDDFEQTLTPNRIYKNIGGTIDYSFILNSIYDISSFEYNICLYTDDGEGNIECIPKNNYFDIIPSIEITEEYQGVDVDLNQISTIKLTTKENIEIGTYRLYLKYQDSIEQYKEFTIGELTFEATNEENVSNIYKGIDNIISFELNSNEIVDKNKVKVLITKDDFEEQINIENPLEENLKYSYNTKTLNEGIYSIKVYYDEAYVSDVLTINVKNKIIAITSRGENLKANKKNPAYIDMTIKEDGETLSYDKSTIVYKIVNTENSDVTDKFYIEVNNDDSNNVLQIVPITEIPAGEYKVYMDLETLSYEHYTTVNYESSSYTVNDFEQILTPNPIYKNIGGKIDYSFELDSIYDLTKFSFDVVLVNEPSEGVFEFISKKEYFDITSEIKESKLFEGINEDLNQTSTITLNTKDNIEPGKYQLQLKYDNNVIDYKNFEIKDDYFEIIVSDYTIDKEHKTFTFEVSTSLISETNIGNVKYNIYAKENDEYQLVENGFNIIESLVKLDEDEYKNTVTVAIDNQTVDYTKDYYFNVNYKSENIYKRLENIFDEYKWDIEEENDTRESIRYSIVEKKEEYEIYILNKNIVDENIIYTIKDSDEELNIAKDNLRNIYQDLDLSKLDDLEFDGTYGLVIKNATKMIVNYKDNYVTFVENGLEQKVSEESFVALEPTLLSKLTEGPYETDDEGNITYKLSGNEKYTKEITEINDEEALAVTGGEYSFTIKYDNYYKDKLDELNFQIKRQEQIIYNNGYSLDENFEVTVDTETGAADNLINIRVLYKGHDASYADDYVLNTIYNDEIIKTLSFKIKRGKSEYVISNSYSEVDLINGESLPTTSKPYNNKKYEYYIDLDMYEYRTEVDYLKDSISCSIYDKEVLYDAENSTDANNVTDQFLITKVEDVDKKTVFKIVPRNEIPAGNYYVYVKHEDAKDIEFAYSDDAEDAALPSEYIGRNPHMTMITYSEPIYTGVEYKGLSYSNSVTDTSKAYKNIESSANLKYIFKDAYNLEKEDLTVDICKLNAEGCDDVTSSFTIDKNFVNPLEYDGTTTEINQESTIVITTKVGEENIGGTYKVYMVYEKNPSIVIEPITFTISDNYYNITFPDEKGIFYNDFEDSITFVANTFAIKNVGDINIELMGPDLVNGPQTFDIDIVNKEFKLDGIAILEYIDRYDEDTNTYSIKLNNIKNALPIGEYSLAVSYKETDNELTTQSAANFEVKSTNASINIIENALDQNNRTVSYNIETQYIDSENINDVDIKVYYSDGTNKIYVSDPDDNNRMFDVNYSFIEDENNFRIYKALLNVIIKPDAIDAAQEYYVEVKYNEITKLVKLPDMNSTFEWTGGITRIYSSLGELTLANNLYRNLTGGIEVELDTINSNIPQYVITNICSETECDISSLQTNNFNSFFRTTEISQRNVKLEYLPFENGNGEMEYLPIGKYQLVVYYSDSNYKVFEFNVEPKYANIELGEPTITTTIDEETTSELIYSNKKFEILIPINVEGVDYSSVVLTLKGNNGGVEQDYLTSVQNSTVKINNKNYIKLTATEENALPKGNYKLCARFSEAPGYVYESNVDLNVVGRYFDYKITAMETDPSILVPNLVGGGKIKYTIETDDLSLEDSGIGNTFISNLVINYVNPENGTETYAKDLFPSRNITQKDGKYILEIGYNFNKDDKDKTTLQPGEYKVKFYYSNGDMEVSREASFTIGAFENHISIIQNQVSYTSFTEAENGQIYIHNNYGGTITVPYKYDYTTLNTNDIKVKILNSSDEVITKNITIDSSSLGEVVVTYRYVNETIPAGTYKIVLEYKDPTTGKVTTDETTFELSEYYKELILENFTAIPSEPVYVEDTDQYFTFNIKDTENWLSSTEKNRIKVTVLNSGGKTVAGTDIANGIFDIHNNNGVITIGVRAYESVPDDYTVYVSLTCNNSDTENKDKTFTSKTINFTIFYKYIYRNYKSQPIIVTNERINDTDLIYDYIGANGDFNFELLNAPEDIYVRKDYSIKLAKADGEVFQTLTNVTLLKNIDDRVSPAKIYYTLHFKFDEIEDYGNIEFQLCIKNLKYTSKVVDVNQYIKATSIEIYSRKDGGSKQVVGDELVIEPNDIRNYYVVAKTNNPELDPTNKKYKFTTDNNIINIASPAKEGNDYYTKMNPVTGGEANITVSSKEISQSFKIKVPNYITSNVYKVKNNIDNEDLTIYVDKMTDTELYRDDFFRNLINVEENYTLYNAAGVDVTNRAEYIGTNFKIKSNEYDYTVIVIGDLNGNGTIDSGDVTYLYRILVGKATLDTTKKKDVYIEQAAHITTPLGEPLYIASDPNKKLGNSTKLFKFYRRDSTASSLSMS